MPLRTYECISLESCRQRSNAILALTHAPSPACVPVLLCANLLGIHLLCPGCSKLVAYSAFALATLDVVHLGIEYLMNLYKKRAGQPRTNMYKRRTLQVVWSWAFVMAAVFYSAKLGNPLCEVAKGVGSLPRIDLERGLQDIAHGDYEDIASWFRDHWHRGESHACLKGELKLYSTIPNRLQQGIFQEGASYSVWARYGSDHLRDDSELNLRSMEIKVRLSSESSRT